MIESQPMTRHSQFDPFGEPVESLAQVADAPQGRASRVLVRVGVGGFWTLVVAIVAARVAFFDPDFAKTFATVAANCLHAVLAG